MGLTYTFDFTKHSVLDVIQYIDERYDRLESSSHSDSSSSSSSSSSSDSDSDDSDVNDNTIYFSTYQGLYQSSGGPGANRQVYQKLGQDILDSGIMVQRGYFADINTDHPFWYSDQIKSFCKLLTMFHKYNCILPFHLAPGLLEAIIGTTIETELEFFAEKIDPCAHRHIQSVSEEDFHTTGFASRIEAYRQICSPDVSDEKLAIYLHMAEYLNLSDLADAADYSDDLSVINLDKILSGEYAITPAMALNIMILVGSDWCSTKQEKMWNDFVLSLSPEEIRSMLQIFGNTLSLNMTYTICVGTNYNVDIKVATCREEVYLHKDLFEDATKLDSLRLYFAIGDDRIRG